MKKYLLLATMLVLTCFMVAQTALSDYSFSYSAGTYTEITGGTALGNTSTDDQRFVTPATPLGETATTGIGFPIGFDFSFSFSSSFECYFIS